MELTFLPGNHSVLAPPDPMPNSAVKRYSADGSVGIPHVRVGHCQAPIQLLAHSQDSCLVLI